MSDREAAAFGKRYGQQSVMTKDGFIGTSGINEGRFSRISGVVEEPDLTKFGTEMDIGGGTVRFSMGTQMDEAGNIQFNERWVSSMDEPNGFITIERYMNPKDAKVLNPEDAAQRTGVATSGEKGYPEIKFHGYYMRGTPPEGAVAQGRNKYVASIPSDKVYDLARDPEGVRAAARASKLLDAGEDAGLKFLAEKGTLLDDDITRELLRRGYWATRNTKSDLPNAVRVFVPGLSEAVAKAVGVPVAYGEVAVTAATTFGIGFLVLVEGVLSAPNLDAAKSLGLAAVLAAGTGLVRLAQAIMTPGESPAPALGIVVPAQPVPPAALPPTR
jgi:hypothetical protein